MPSVRGARFVNEESPATHSGSSISPSRKGTIEVLTVAFPLNMRPSSFENSDTLSEKISRGRVNVDIESIFGLSPPHCWV